VFNGERVLLAQCGKEPNRGRWTIPGGAIELGKSVRQAVEREVREVGQQNEAPLCEGASSYLYATLW
jgi:ADP-ribose pyrophosphatase YjhB (NUDIX family)